VNYFPAAAMSQVPEGEAVSLTVNGRAVLLCQVEGQFFAVSAICPHAGQKLYGGRLRGFEVACPLHRARFDIRDGACLAAPAQDPLISYPILLEGGKVSIGMS
jgi:3-phenylpropionate/trans-cinnamate dioxygenase ferredoxin subunit